MALLLDGAFCGGGGLPAGGLWHRHCRLVSPSSGAIRVNDASLETLTPKWAGGKGGGVPQGSEQVYF